MSLAKFDPSTLMQGVKDRIKSEFVSLIPDEQWNEMVQKEINDFFKEKETGYSNRNYASDFSILVRDELKAETKKKISRIFYIIRFCCNMESVWITQCFKSSSRNDD